MGFVIVNGKEFPETYFDNIKDMSREEMEEKFRAIFNGSKEEKSELSRDFKGVWIPKEIYLNKNLSWTEKILIVEINSLDRGEGCFASNEYLAEFLMLTKQQIVDMVTKLRKLGIVIDRKFDGRKRHISINKNYADYFKTRSQHTGNPVVSIRENKVHNNIINNKDYNNSIVTQYYERSFSSKNTTEKGDGKKPYKVNKIQQLINHFFSLKGWTSKDLKTQNIVYARFTRPARDLLDLCEQNVELATAKLTIIKNWADVKGIDWGIETVFKRWFDLDKLPQEREKRPKFDGLPAYEKNGRWYCIDLDGTHKQITIGYESQIEYV